MDRGLHRFCPALCPASRQGVFHRARQIQYSMPKALFSPCGQNNRIALRPNDYFNHLSVRQGLSGKTPPYQIFRCRAQSTADILNQPLYARCHQYRATIQMPLEDRVIFQMDQTTPAYQGIFGTSENAVKSQIWIAISIYVLIAIIKKELKLKQSLYTILQILSVTIFNKTHILQALTETDLMDEDTKNHNQLELFKL